MAVNMNKAPRVSLRKRFADPKASRPATIDYTRRTG